MYLHDNKMALLYPQALGSLFVASYESQGYGEDILTRLHMGISLELGIRNRPKNLEDLPFQVRAVPNGFNISQLLGYSVM
jgi:hypothetical protein